MHTFTIAVLSGLLACTVSAASDEPFSFCTDNKCEQCPVNIASAGKGYPACVVYNSDDVFKNQDFPGSEGGGYQPYLDIPQPDPGCKVLVRSPADTTQAGCGFLKGAFGNAACAVLSIEKTFMVQFCCGLGDCNAAGAGARRIKRSAKFGDVTVFEELDKEAFNAAAAGGGMFSYKLRSANGSVIEPAAIGLPPDTATDRASKDAQAAVPAVKKSVSNPLQARVDKCEEGSWVPDAGKEDYTKPADGTQVVYGSVSGPATIEITKARTQDWTTTMDASLGFGNILSMGISFSNEYGESITDTKSQSFPVPAGQTGSVGFTPYLECTTGHGKCGGKEVSGEVCAPYKSSDRIAGMYAVIVSS